MMKLAERKPFLDSIRMVPVPDKFKPVEVAYVDKIPPAHIPRVPVGLVSKPSPLHEGRRVFAKFPEYEFDSDGNAFRVYSTAHRGPAPQLGPVTLNSFGQYSLRDKDGKRVSVSRRRIKAMFAGTEEGVYVSKFELEEFPNDYFDMAGNAFCARTGRIRKSHPAISYGRDVKRFRLFHARSGRFEWITDAALRRMRDGRSSYRSASPPDGCLRLGQEFLDYCVDPCTGQPYRISSVRYAIAEPIRIAPNSDGSFNIRNFAGKRYTFRTETLREMAIPNPEPFNPES